MSLSTLAFTGQAIGGGTDYNASSNQITIPAGSLSGTTTITSAADLLDELDETVVIEIIAVTGGNEDGLCSR